MKNLFIVLSFITSLSSFAHEDINNQYTFYCDGIYLKNLSGKTLASSGNCIDNLLRPSRDGLFCDGISLKNLSGETLATSGNCIDNLLRPTKNGLFCDGISLKNLYGETLATSGNCKDNLLGPSLGYEQGRHN